MDDFDTALGDEELHALIELGDDLVFIGHHRGHIDGHLLAADESVLLTMSDLMEDFGRVQEGLGRDTAYIQAGAAEDGVLFDEGYLEAELGGLNGGDITAGAGTDDNEIELRH